ncbi:hypothetical protein DES45_102672, partial [Microvirga subterranea]
VWLDGQQVVNYSGAVGYTDQSTTHWNMGIYRSSPTGNETLAVQVKSPDLSYGTSASAAKHGAPAADTLSSDPTSAPLPTPSPDADQTAVPGKTLIGGWTSDTLIGTSGDDKLFGKGGSDLLTGGEGKDTFAFDTRLDGSRIDKITDFDVNDDTIQLDDAIFASLVQGKLGEANFRTGGAALDRNDYILYDRASGTISYDPDGSGWQDAMAFAKVTPGLALTYDHFFVV